MFKSQTVFVVGAGASFEVDIPLGSGLASQIGTMCDVRYEGFNQPVGNGDGALFREISHNFRHSDMGLYQQAAWIIRDGIILARSIDDFLSIHEQNLHVKEYGKAAIVKAVMKAERASKLFVDRRTRRDSLDFRNVADTWFVKFIRMLGPGSSPGSLFDRVGFVVFNYDRCVEQFLSHAPRALFNLSEAVSKQVFSTARILHPYGYLGALTDVPFGSDDVFSVPLASQIRTYAERVQEGTVGTELTAIREMIRGADTLVFLGFGFHDENMDLLFPPGITTEARRVFATARGSSASDCAYVLDRIARAAPIAANTHHGIQIRSDLTCTHLFDEYQKTMPALLAKHNFP
jgi:hypothetical protein